MQENTVRVESSEDAESQGDLFDAYFSLVENSSESPLIYHRWTLISAVAALLGRNAKLPFGHDTIYPNMYVCLMGSAGSRKSSAINITKKLLTGAGYNTFAREKSSNQKFIKDLGEGFEQLVKRPKPKNAIETFDEELLELEVENGYEENDEKPSEVYITAGELEDFLGQNDGQFISLLTNLWDNLDTYSHGKITGDDIFINEPTVNMIGGTTPVTFSTVFPPEVIGQGMLSRLLLVYGGGARCKITMPPPPDPAILADFVELLQGIKDTIKGNFTITPEAYQIWDDIYQTGIDLQDNRLESYLNRRHVHYYKLCMVLAACELSMEITAEIAIKANTILHWTECLMPKALGEFGKSKKSELSQVIIDELSREGRVGLSTKELLIRVSKDFEDNREFATVLSKLKETGVIEIQHRGANGELGYLVMAQARELAPVPHVNFELLREFRDSQ